MGIGTNTPDYKLTVNCKIKCEELLVVVDVPDYVFKEGYQRLSLEETERYIRKHGHLPGIKSEAEIKTSGGWNLGEMNGKLLEKIEELTLFLIELEKENRELNDRVRKLEK